MQVAGLKKRLNRRQFLKTSAMRSAAIAAPMVVPASALGRDGKTAPSERITIGMIGVGRQARVYNLPWFLNSKETQVVAICEVDAWRLDNAVKMVQEHSGSSSNQVSTYRDFRDLLAVDAIDAVMISTPDHWHVPMAIAAVRQGKDVCCEKPVTKSIDEGRRLVAEVAQHERVFRVDSEARFKVSFCKAAEVVRNGRIGSLLAMEVGVPEDNDRCGQPPEMPVPEELDYDLWLGPAAESPYTVQRVHPRRDYSRGGWMRIRDYDDGMITNWGAHLIDIAHWGSGLERTGPVRVEGSGVFPKNELWNALQDFDVKYTYANGITLTVKSVADHYTRFIGEAGWVEAGFGHVKASDPDVLRVPLGQDKIRLPRLDEKQDFVNCVKSRRCPVADAEIGHRTNSIGLLGVIAAEVGTPLSWDPVKEVFIDNAQANQLLTRSVRDPWGEF